MCLFLKDWPGVFLFNLLISKRKLRLVARLCVLMASIKKTIFSIITRPLITEKTAGLSAASNCVVFAVHPHANKVEIKNAVQEIFNVKVDKVRTVNCMGTPKKVNINHGREGNWKKAYVSLAEGNSIDLVEGL